MKVQLQKSYPMPGPAEVVWGLLQDIEAVAGCMPGAKITERVDDTHYKGTVAVRMGPANLSFRGEIEVQSLDAATRSLRLAAKGSDTTGGSAASMTLSARVEPVDAATCTLLGESTTTMSGKVASFGARLAQPVAEQVIGQFAANFAALVGTRRTDMEAAAGAQPAPAAVPEAKALDGLALVWAIVKGWLRGLFGRRS